MVLDDVARRADAVVVPGPAADADVLGHGDLHVVDVVGVPDRFEHLVREPQRQEVLDGLLAQVVVDAEHGVLVEHLGDDGVQLARAGQVVTERLLDDDATPRALLRRRQPVLLELAHHGGERAGRDRQVERVVAAGTALGVQRLDRVAQRLERVVVVERALHEPDPLGQLAPRRLPERSARVLFDGVVHHLGEVLGGPVAAREAGQGEPRRQQATVGQVVHGGHELLARQVARDAEDHQPLGPAMRGRRRSRGSRSGL